nr:NADH:flavin oxidoreductase [Desulfobulbaceae bacterium]
MSKLFEQTTINGMTLNNRLVRSATWEGMCEKNGRPTKKLADFYKTLAEGDVGLIISGYAFVRPEGKQLPGKMGIHVDDFADDMHKMTKSVHDAGGKICIQLVHAGGQTDSATAGQTPLAPSSVEAAQFSEKPESLTKEQIREIVGAFAQSAVRAKIYGFDAVQLHGAHGYLINQFLSPLTNKRDDEYGGSLENRCRFMMEVYGAVRDAVGPAYPVMIKLNCADFLDGGFQLEDAVYAAKALDKLGIDAIEVSGGTPASGDQSPARAKIKNPAQEGYHLGLAKKIKAVVGCPVMVVGGMRSLGVIEKALFEDGLDYVSLARPLIREPGLAKRWREGETSAAKCISCNGCFMPGVKEGGIYCVAEKKEQEKQKTAH